MTLFFIEIGKYINIVLAGIYCILAYISLGRKDEDGRNGIFHVLEFITILLFLSGVTDLALAHSYAGDDVAMRNVILLGIAEAAGLFAFARLMYHFYPEMNRLLLADMEFMLCIGFVVLMRLNYRHALRQYIIIAAGLAVSMFIPWFIHRIKLIRKTGWICGVAGVTALLVVYIHGSITNGAKLSMKICGLTFQPSEIIKILFAFFIAGILYKSAGFIKIVIATACASALILILTISRDLGMALIYSVMLIAMIYMASGKIRYVLIGTGAGAGAAVAAYNLFSHVRVRFNVWMDPWTDIDNTGYQLTQSLFAIGTGNWFGMGIGRGKPTTIPDVEDDFIFSAISEESGLIFGIILILVCLNLLITMLLMVGRVQDSFFRIAGMGMAVCYGIQTVLTIGGGTMFIPLTGVTLPLVSNGGSSAMATLLLFAVLQGISLIRMDEIYEGTSPVKNEEVKKEKPGKKEKTENKEKPEKKEKSEKKEKPGKKNKEPRESKRRTGAGAATNEESHAEAGDEGAYREESEYEKDTSYAGDADDVEYDEEDVSDEEFIDEEDDEEFSDEDRYPEAAADTDYDDEDEYEEDEEDEEDDEYEDDDDDEENDEYEDDDDDEENDEYEDDEYDEDDEEDEEDDEYDDDSEYDDDNENGDDDFTDGEIEEDPEYEDDEMTDEDAEEDAYRTEITYSEEPVTESDTSYYHHRQDKGMSEPVDEDYADEFDDSDKKF